MRFHQPAHATVCNVCGSKLDFWDLQEDFTIHKRVGYGSVYDLKEVRLQMCCSCFDQIAESCAITPVVKEFEW